MKLKTLALSASAVLLTVSLAYAAPAVPSMQLADDMSAMDTDTGATPSTGAAGAENIGSPTDSMEGPQTGNEMAQSTTPTTNAPTTTQTPNQSSNTNDDMSADTATGDDDY
jgi:hypothetical protein